MTRSLGSFDGFSSKLDRNHDNELDKYYWGSIVDDDDEPQDNYFEAVQGMSDDSPILHSLASQTWLMSEENYNVANVSPSPQVWFGGVDCPSVTSTAEDCLNVMQFFNGFYSDTEAQSVDISNGNGNHDEFMKTDSELEMIFDYHNHTQCDNDCFYANNVTNRHTIEKNTFFDDPVSVAGVVTPTAADSNKNTQELCKYFRAIEYGYEIEMNRDSPIKMHLDKCGVNTTDIALLNETPHTVVKIFFPFVF